MATGNHTARNIPLPVQRAVRQRCGFGCVICGLPLYEYDHMKGWATVHEHVAEDIVLLCDQHHREVTSGLLPRQDVVEANANPHNRRSGQSASLPLHYSGKQCRVHIGGNDFIATRTSEDLYMAALVVDGITLAGFIIQDDQLLLNIALFDECNNLALHVKNNQLYYTAAPWDIEFVGKRITIRERARRILIEIVFDPPSDVVVNRGRILCNGVEILVEPDSMTVTNNMITFVGCTAMATSGVVIGRSQLHIGCCIRMDQVPRYLNESPDARERRKLTEDYLDGRSDSDGKMNQG